MADQSITIKFQPQGHEKLISAINKLDVATKKLQKQTKRLNHQGGVFDTTFTRNRKNMNMFGNTLATVRSKMLLWSFLMSLGIRQMMQMSKEAAKLASMETAFNTLTGGIGNASIAIERLQEATDGTMSKFDLFQQANNAMILGVSKNSEEMAEMFDMAQRLGEALGKDTKESVESLITGIGRQSRLMLDNIGIIVKADEAYEKFASNIGTTVDKLTDQQKKQAFLNATLDSAREKVDGLNEEIPNATKSFNALQAASSDLASTIGEKLNRLALKPLAEILTGVVKATEDLITKTDLERMNDLKNVIDANTNGFINFADRVRDAKAELLGLQLKAFSPMEEGTIRMIDFNKQYLDSLVKIEGSSVDFAANEALREKDRTKNAFLSSQGIVENRETIVRAKLMEALSGHIASIMTSVPFPINLLLAGGAGLAINELYSRGVAGLKTLKFEQGGLVGGRRHSQGGTMIEAEQGEFVMSRSAVEAVGIENMNRINRGGSAVTVNVSGNVMTQDFVEGDLAEAIRNAARRGTDFGVS